MGDYDECTRRAASNPVKINKLDLTKVTLPSEYISDGIE